MCLEKERLTLAVCGAFRSSFSLWRKLSRDLGEKKKRLRESVLGRALRQSGRQDQQEGERKKPGEYIGKERMAAANAGERERPTRRSFLVFKSTMLG